MLTEPIILKISIGVKSIDHVLSKTINLFTCDQVHFLLLEDEKQTDDYENVKALKTTT